MNTDKAKNKKKIAPIRNELPIEYQNTEAQDVTDWPENGPKSVSPGNPVLNLSMKNRLIEHNRPLTSIAKEWVRQNNGFRV